jgi:filamentous hemagglutinin family protein
MQSHSRAVRAFLLTSAAVLSLPGMGLANPLGSAVTSGSATVSHPASNDTTVKQTSEGVVIDWSSFNVGAGQTTQFVQPNAQAIAVNRIGGKNGSEIMGTLDANGRIVLINGNGVLFGKGAQVNVGSLLATSTDGSDSDVLSGKFTNAGNPNAKVVNQGQIVVGTSGVVALVAPSVTNTGIVNAKLGTVALGAANKFTVDFTGDGLVSFTAQGDVNTRASAANMGTLSGANVSLTAHAAEGLATGVVSMKGTILAQGVQNVGGTILLDAGSGTLTTSGTLNAAGASGGGNIETSGNTANISGHITAGLGGKWTVDPANLVIDSATATTIDDSLNAGTNVTESTTPASPPQARNTGAGDITVASGLSWNTTATLTLDAYHSLNIDAPIQITGAGGLILQFNDAATDGSMNFSSIDGGSGHVAFTDEDINGNTLGSLTVNSTSYQLVNSIAQLQTAIAGNGSATVALANSYNASGDGTYFAAPVYDLGAGGVFEGLGNTISNLAVTAPNESSGLFYENDGTVRDIAIVGGSFNSTFGAAALVGQNNSTIADSFASASVSQNGGNYAGELTAFNYGAISNSHSAGTVTGGAGGTSGGLVGINQASISGSFSTATVTNAGGDFTGGLVGDNAGSITNSFAMGSVSGGASVGGLVGYNSGTVDASYSTGVATGTDQSGGFVGSDEGGRYTADYWDTSTSGIAQATANNGTPSGITGATTSGLQTALDGTWNTGVWAIVPKISFPYLLWQAPTGTPQVIAGHIFADNSLTQEAGLGVTAMIDGTAPSPLVNAASGADGYYYMLFAPGTISGTGSNVLVSLTGNTPGSSYTAAKNSILDLPIEENWLRVRTDAPDSQTVVTDINNAAGSDIADSLFSQDNVAIDDSASIFTIDSAIDVGTNVLNLDIAGSIAQNGGFIGAGVLDGNSIGGVALNGPLRINALGNFSNLGAGGFSLTDNETLFVDGQVASGTGDLTLTTNGGRNGIGTAAGSNASITLNPSDIDIFGRLISGGTVALFAGGAISEKSSTQKSVTDAPPPSIGGSILAQTLTGHSYGATTLNGFNLIANLGDFSANGFALTDNISLRVLGAVNSGAGNLSLTAASLKKAVRDAGDAAREKIGDMEIDGSLTSAGAVALNAWGSIWERPGSQTNSSAQTTKQAAPGAITAATLTGSSGGTTELMGTNLIANLGDFAGYGKVVLVDNQGLTVIGDVNTGKSNLTLDVNQGDLVVDGALTAGTMTLASLQGQVYGTGAITANVLDVSANTGIDLDGPNSINIVHRKTNTGPDIVHTTP